MASLEINANFNRKACGVPDTVFLIPESTQYKFVSEGLAEAIFEIGQWGDEDGEVREVVDVYVRESDLAVIVRLKKEW